MMSARISARRPAPRSSWLPGVQSASAANSPNMRLDYSLLDPTSGRTDSDIAFWGNIGVAGQLRRVPRLQHRRRSTGCSPASSAAARRTTSRSGSTTGGSCSSSRSTRRKRRRRRLQREPLERHDRVRPGSASRGSASSTSLTRRPGPTSRASTPTAARTRTRWSRISRTTVCCSTSPPTRASTGPNCQSPFREDLDRRSSAGRAGDGERHRAAAARRRRVARLPRHHRLPRDPQGGRVVRDRGPDLGHHATRPIPDTLDPGARRRRRA